MRKYIVKKVSPLATRLFAQEDLSTSDQILAA
jgi:hypothetical protein